MLEDIGEGKFGIVKLGMHKKTKEKVAIKIIKKESMNSTCFGKYDPCERDQ
jgi:serine/threonine protein kinase